MRVTFFRVAERKSPKKGRPCCLRPLRFAAGQPGVLGHGVHRRTRCAPMALRSNNCGKSVHEACALRRACHPAPCAPQAHTEGNPGSGHPHGPLLRCAALGPISRAQAPRAAQARPSAAMARVAVRPLEVRLPNPLLAAPAAGRLRGGTRVGARVLRELTRRGCPSGARSAKRVPRRTPQPTRRRFAPSQRDGVADWGSPFFWVLFFGEAKNKYLGRRAETRLPPLAKASLSNQHARLRPAQPERTGGLKPQKQ